MAHRPKRYGGGTDREREELDPRKTRRSRSGSSPEEAASSMRHGRASEAAAWEREESLDDEDVERGYEQDRPRR